MINKLPGWVEVGGFFLAFIGGSINAIALLGLNHQGVSHLTGSSSLLSVSLAEGSFSDSTHLLIVIASFVIGAAVSGLLIGNESLKLGRRYSLALFLEALLLLMAMKLLTQGSIYGHYLASAACGLQNAMTSTFSGAVVRTTHVTGLFTDLGIMLGLRVRGQRADTRRIILYATLISGFIAGGIVGAYLFMESGFTAIAMPALMSTLMAMTYLLYWWIIRRNDVRS